MLSILIVCVMTCGVFSDLRMALSAAAVGWVTLFFTYARSEGWFQFDDIALQRLFFGFFLLFGSAMAVGRLKNRLLAAEVRLLEERYRDYASLFKEIDVPIVECDWQKILSVNGAFCRMTGFAEADLVNLKPPYPFWPAAEQAQTIRALESAMRGLAHEFELTLVRKDGTPFPVLMYVSQIRNAKGEITRQVFSYHDLSLFKRTERELREAEKTLSDAIFAADMAVLVTDGSASVAHVRGNFEQLHGMAPGSFSGRFADIQKVVPAEDFARIMATLRKAREDRVNFELHYRVNHSNGQHRWLRSTGCYQYDGSGEPVHGFMVLQDMTPIRHWLDAMAKFDGA